MAVQHHRVRTGLLLLLLLALLLLSARHGHVRWDLPWNLDWVRGPGHPVDQPRSVASFHHLQMAGSLDVEVQAGAEDRVVVHADDNIADLIQTDVVDDTLVVRERPHVSFRTTQPVVVRVVARSLEGVELLGSGDLTLSGLQGGSLELDLTGSGTVTGKGHLDALKARIDGSGDLHLAKLAAEQVDVAVNGSGNARVTAHDRLHVRINGSGDVQFGGHPRRVTGKVSGSGTVTEAD